MKRYRIELLVLSSVVLAATGQTLIKLGFSGHGVWMSIVLRRPLLLTAGVLCGLFVYGLGTLLWFVAVSKRNISYLYPLAATNYILMGLIGHFLLREAMGPYRLTGIAVMAGGIAMLSGTGERVAEQ